MKWALRLFAVTALLAAGLLAWAMHPKGADDGAAPILPSPETALPARPDLRVAHLGTSLTAALPVAMFEARASACLGRDVAATVVAAGGQTSLWGAGQLDRVIAAAPDVIFVEFSINDADLRRRVSLSDSARAHRSILTELQTALPQAKIVFLRLNRAYGLRAALRPRQARYDAIAHGLAMDSRAGYLDLRGQWAMAGQDVLPDGIHPTPEAIEEITIPALVTTLSQMQSGQDCEDA